MRVRIVSRRADARSVAEGLRIGVEWLASVLSVHKGLSAAGQHVAQPRGAWGASRGSKQSTAGALRLMGGLMQACRSVASPPPRGSKQDTAGAMQPIGGSAHACRHIARPIHIQCPFGARPRPLQRPSEACCSHVDDQLRDYATRVSLKASCVAIAVLVAAAAQCGSVEAHSRAPCEACLVCLSACLAWFACLARLAGLSFGVRA